MSRRAAKARVGNGTGLADATDLEHYVAPLFLDSEVPVLAKDVKKFVVWKIRERGPAKGQRQEVDMDDLAEQRDEPLDMNAYELREPHLRKYLPPGEYEIEGRDANNGLVPGATATLIVSPDDNDWAEDETEPDPAPAPVAAPQPVVVAAPAPATNTADEAEKILRLIGEEREKATDTAWKAAETILGTATGRRADDDERFASLRREMDEMRQRHYDELRQRDKLIDTACEEARRTRSRADDDLQQMRQAHYRDMDELRTRMRRDSDTEIDRLRRQVGQLESDLHAERTRAQRQNDENSREIIRLERELAKASGEDKGILRELLPHGGDILKGAGDFLARLGDGAQQQQAAAQQAAAQQQQAAQEAQQRALYEAQQRAAYEEMAARHAAAQAEQARAQAAAQPTAVPDAPFVTRETPRETPREVKHVEPHPDAPANGVDDARAAAS